MSRYIDADALIEYLKEMWGKWDEDDWYEAQAKDAMEDDIEIVNKQPTIDVATVMHGEWLPIIGGNEYGDAVQVGCYCSMCGEELQYEQIGRAHV